MSALSTRRPLGSRRLASLGALLFMTLLPARVLGQSAADKTAARELAVEGINLFKEGSYAPALERLERAQALYDAHVHLVYIARAQAKLGKLVEASEAYRALARKPLPPDASDVVKNAKAEGAEELARLEPRIPRLRIEVEPRDAKGLELTINGEAVSAAAIGVERPVNPGKVVVRVGGDGWKASEATLDVPEAAKKAVTLKLEPGPKAASGGGAGAARTGAGAGTAGQTPESEPNQAILLGLRGVMTVPFGELESSAPPPLDEFHTARIADLVDYGGGAEARFGFRFLRQFTGLVWGEGHILNPRPRGARWQLDEIGLAVPEARNATSVPFGYRFGLGFMYTRVRPGVDWFAEADVGYQGIRSGIRVERDDGLSDCKRIAELSGGLLRATGGVAFKVSRIFSVYPFGSFALGRFTKGSVSGDCGQSVELDLKGVQGWVALGLGGDLLLPLRD